MKFLGKNLDLNKNNRILYKNDTANAISVYGPLINVKNSFSNITITNQSETME